MNIVDNHLRFDAISVEKVLDFLPYPFLVSTFHKKRRRNIFVNKRFIDEIGYTIEDIPTIDEWFEKAYPDPAYRQEIIERWTERERYTQINSEDYTMVRAKIHTKSGDDFWYQVKASISGPVRMVAFINIQDEINKEEQLHRLNENKNRTLSILSHDLRVPVNNLNSLLELSKNGSINRDEFLLHIETIADKTVNQLTFLETTLEWTQANFDLIRPVYKPVKIKQTICSIVNIYEPNCHKKNIVPIVIGDEDDEILCDEQIIAVIFRNIFSNAIKFTHEGAISVYLNGNASEYQIAVQDTGVGMTEEKIASLFNGDYGSESGTRSEKGLGLGFRLSVELVKRIGGHLRIDSNVGNGTTVTITIPSPSHFSQQA